MVCALALNASGWWGGTVDLLCYPVFGHQSVPAYGYLDSLPWQQVMEALKLSRTGRLCDAVNEQAALQFCDGKIGPGNNDAPAVEEEVTQSKRKKRSRRSQKRTTRT